MLCPFKIVATRCESIHLLKFTTSIEKHNHPLFDLTVQLKVWNRRLAPSDQAEILELRAADVNIADIVTILANRSGKYISNRQICSVLCSTAKEAVTGMSECSKLHRLKASNEEVTAQLMNSTKSCANITEQAKSFEISCFFARSHLALDH